MKKCPLSSILLWQNDESFHLFVTFLSPFFVEGDKFWSQKGDEKFTHFVKKM
jgi:hypothetical protein